MFKKTPFIKKVRFVLGMIRVMPSVMWEMANKAAPGQQPVVRERTYYVYSRVHYGSRYELDMGIDQMAAAGWRVHTLIAYGHNAYWEALYEREKL